METVHFSVTGKKRGPFFAERLTCSVADAVTVSGLSRSHLYKKMVSGELEFRNHGRRRLIVVKSLRKLLGLDDA
jgi:hypothetical protein